MWYCSMIVCVSTTFLGEDPNKIERKIHDCIDSKTRALSDRQNLKLEHRTTSIDFCEGMYLRYNCFGEKR